MFAKRSKSRVFSVFFILAIMLAQVAPSYAVSGTTTRVSVDSSGLEGNSESTAPSISADGRYVTFQSFATNLVSGDTNGAYDIFLRDTVANTTERVSVDSNGVQANFDSSAPFISADGRYVAFQSSATNLVSGDTNGRQDIFVRDTVANITTRLSVDSSGVQGNHHSSVPSISANGRYVAFYSFATNLVSGDTNGAYDVFIHDTVANTTTRVSVDSSSAQANSHSISASISDDGRYVAFHSTATNLVSGDTNGVADVFMRDTMTNTTTRLSVDSSSIQGNSDSLKPSISADGRYVAFQTFATNLVSGDTNGVPDVLVRDIVVNTTTRVSVDSSGVQGNSESYPDSISADGLYVAFFSSATNLVSGDTNGRQDIFVRDTVANTTTRLSVDSSGVQGNHHSQGASISADGRYIAFYSDATNLVGGDANGVSDVFVHDQNILSTSTPTFTPTDAATPTPTSTNTPSPTATFTPTSTDTPTFTPTDTPTSTPTDTLTYTPTMTDTPTSTPTDTPTSTPTDTPTSTPTDTPTNTPTFTPTATETPTPTPTSTQTPTPTNTPTPTYTSTPTSVSDLIFKDGFESGGLSAWTSSVTDRGDLSVSPAAALVGTNGLRALIDNNPPIFITDDTPNAERRYRARFYFDPNSITMRNGDAHYIFYGYSGTSTIVLRMEFRRSTTYQLRAQLRNDANTFSTTNWFTISDSPHFIEIDWRASTAAGANNGGLTLWIDGLLKANGVNIDNDTRRIDRVQLGAVAGIDTRTRGTYFFDAFESRRQTFIGP